MVAADIIAGTFGGVAVVLVGHPFDTTKTRLQTAPPSFYINTLDCVRKTMQWEGARGFYTGMCSPLLGQMFFRATSFSTYYYTTKFLQQSQSQQLGYNATLNSSQLVACGGFTGFVISFVECPIDFLKTKLQVSIFQKRLQPNFEAPYTCVFQCASYHMKHFGARSLWQGLSGTLIRNVPANALFFPTNDLIKRYYAEANHIPVDALDVKYNLIAGAVAGLSYWVGIYPLDIVKARMQCAESGSHPTWWATARDIYREGGLRAFGRGFLPCALRAVPACATMFATVDLVRSVLNKK